MSRDALMDLLKGEALEAFDRSIDVHISRIRNAIEDDPKKPRRIITVRSAGYVFARSRPAVPQSGPGFPRLSSAIAATGSARHAGSICSST